MAADLETFILLAVCCVCAFCLYLALKKDNSRDLFAGMEEAIEAQVAKERIRKRVADIKEIYTELRVQMPHLSHEDAADRAVEIYEQRELIY